MSTKSPRTASSAEAVGAALPLILTVALAGCGRATDRLDVATVRGVVTVDGEPAEGAQLTLHPLSGPAADAGLRPLATVGPDGSFEVTTYGAHDGAPVGEYTVTVSWRVLEYPQGDDADPELGPNLVDKQYANPKTSDWKVTISAGANQLEAVDLPGQVQTASRPTRNYEE